MKITLVEIYDHGSYLFTYLYERGFGHVNTGMSKAAS